MILRSARILLKDKSAWERRILRNIEDRQRMFHQIILSVVTSVIISGIILYLPVFEHGYQQQYHCADTVCSSYSA